MVPAQSPCETGLGYGTMSIHEASDEAKAMHDEHEHLDRHSTKRGCLLQILNTLLVTRRWKRQSTRLIDQANGVRTKKRHIRAQVLLLLPLVNFNFCHSRAGPPGRREGVRFGMVLFVSALGDFSEEEDYFSVFTEWDDFTATFFVWKFPSLFTELRKRKN